MKFNTRYLGMVLISVSQLCFANQVDIHVTLNPAGSFVAKTQAVSIKGKSVRKGNNFSVSDVNLNLDSLESGIHLRDSHMKKKYFETDKYPTAVLKKAIGKDGKLVGILALHNSQRKIAGTYEVSNDNIKAHFKCKLSDFSITEASYMGIGVEDEVEVIAELNLR